MTHPMTPTPTPGANTMTDTKALLAEARLYDNSDGLMGAPGSPNAKLCDIIRRLAAALEEATMPEGWRVTEYVKGSEYAANAARTWSATPGKWWLHGDHREFPTAREAMAALDEKEKTNGQ